MYVNNLMLESRVNRELCRNGKSLFIANKSDTAYKPYITPEQEKVNF